ncbi:ParB N-terminal domain-containing protein [Streptomyces echinatus]|uniref:ParB N-terminal domain-containing protein n=1 Tax=Streptomyces echinatus TaxID=67293 RepID=UPI00379ACFAC
MLAEAPTPLPPIVVHRPTMRIIDGMHRVQAAVLRGEDRVEVRFVDGTADDAFVLAVRLNAEHGMPLSRRDRVAAAERIISSHGRWSDRRIAEVTGLSPVTVSALRRRTTADSDQVEARTGRDGRSRPVDSAVGRRRAVQVIAARPDASLREIAQEAGIAPATARDVRRRIREGKDPVPAKLRGTAQDSGEAAGSGVRNRVLAETAGHGPRVRSEPVVVAGPGRFANLRKDPSLRFSEAGRALLQLLAAANELDDERWRWLMSAVPAHRHADIARAARLCGERWLTFAEELERGSGMRASRAV